VPTQKTSSLQGGFDRNIASLIDHTLLRPDAVLADVLAVCSEALQYEFAGVCVNPYWVQTVAKELSGSQVRVCTVAGFPLGATSSASKRAEAESCIRAGAHEIDMVMNIGALKGGDNRSVQADIEGVVAVAHAGGGIVKVIIETALLTDDEKRRACLLAEEAHAAYVKTSTGFSTRGATTEDVALMRATVGQATGVKASGGIKTLDDLRRMVAAGATRIGASSSVAIIQATAQA
jgi:deoxyribose-phosphate aldolase